MQPASGRKVQSAINVTPLVDVVLVLLIIFMVVAPQLQSGPDLELPRTDRPADEPEEQRLLVAIDREGSVWVESDEVAPDGLAGKLAEAGAVAPDRHVVIRGDAGLTFGDVRRVMLTADAAGFGHVGLMAQRRERGE